MFCEIVGRFVRGLRKTKMDVYFQGRVKLAPKFESDDPATAKMLKKLMGGSFSLALKTPLVEPVTGKIITSVRNQGGVVILEMKGPVIRRFGKISGEGQLF